MLSVLAALLTVFAIVDEINAQPRNGWLLVTPPPVPDVSRGGDSGEFDHGEDRVGDDHGPVGPSWKCRVNRSGMRSSSREPTRMVAVLRIGRKPSAARIRAAQIKVACGSCHGATVCSQSAA
jgi:hypothetical protein